MMPTNAILRYFQHARVIIFVFATGNLYCGGGTLQSFAQTGKGVSSVAYHPSGAALAVGGYQVVSILDSGTGKELAKLPGHAGNVTSVQFSSDGNWLAAGGGLPGNRGEVKLWNVAWIKSHDVQKGKPVPVTLTGPSDAVYSVSFSPNGKQLAAASYDHDISVWTVGAPVPNHPRTLKDHTDAVYAVAFSPDGRFIASGAGDRTVKIWSAQTGKRLYTLSESTAEVYSLAFRPDSKQIAAGGADKQLRVWNINATEGKLTKSAFAHNGAILRVAYSQNGQSILTSGEDDAVKRWSAADILEQKVYPKLPDWPQGIALSPNGKALAIGCHNGLLAIYDAATGKLIREPMRGMPVLANTDHGAMPKTSTIPGRRLGDNKQRGPLNTGGITLRAASLGDMAPKGAPRGGTVRFTLFGGLISDAMGVYFDDPAITGKVVTPADPNNGILRVDVALSDKARLGLHRVFVQSPHGTTGSVVFAVGGWPEVMQAEPNNTPETSQKIAVPCTVVGALDTPGDIDCYKVEAKAGEELVFEVVAQPLRSRLQPVLTLMNAEGKTLAESQTRIGRSDTLLGYRFTESGSYVIQLRDFESAGGGDVHYRLNIGEFPVVTDVFPLGGKAGSPVDIEVKGFNLGGVTASKLNLPDYGGTGSTAAAMFATPKGPQYLTRPIQVGMDPEVRQTIGNETLATSQKIDVPVAVNGRLTASTTHDAVNNYYRFAAKKGQVLSLDVVARRFGSPLDSEIEILDSSGKPIERAVVRPVYSTEVTLNDRDSATNALRIFAWDGVGINDYMMIGREVVKVGEMPRGPDSDIFFRTYRGQRLTYFGTTPEYHSVGQQVYKVEVHPAGTRFSPNGYPVTRLTYRNDDGGMLYGKDSHLDFIAPEDGEYVVRIADTRGLSGPEYAYRLLIHPPRPDYKIVMSPDHPNLPKGGGTVVNVDCERYDGFNGAIDLKLEGLPAGFTATSTSIEPGETSASFLISASKDAVTSTDPVSKSSMRVVGTARIDDKDVRHEIGPDAGVRLFTVMGGPDVTVTTGQKELTIHPGEEIMLEVTAQRQGMFGGRVPLEVKNLPFGVQVQNIGLNGILIPEQETSRTIAIRCEPWVKPQTRSFYVLASVEGGVSNAAAPITIRVEPSSSRSASGRTIRSASTSARK